MQETYVVFDLETTGLQPSNDRILEIGALKIQGDTIVEEFSSFVNPRMEIPRRVTELTGITQKMVMDAPLNEEVIHRFLEFCEGCDVIGHNILFDFSFIKVSAVNQARKFEKKGCDTLHIARKALPQLESRSLSALCEYYGISQGHAHRALDDAKATYLLYKKLKETFADTMPEAFTFRPLSYQVKKKSPITKFQKVYLNDLIKYHKIDFNVEIDSMTKNDASRAIDKIILKHGRIKR